MADSPHGWVTVNTATRRSRTLYDRGVVLEEYLSLTLGSNTRVNITWRRDIEARVVRMHTATPYVVVQYHCKDRANSRFLMAVFDGRGRATVWSADRGSSYPIAAPLSPLKKTEIDAPAFTVNTPYAEIADWYRGQSLA